jgi:hypothetical protein
LASAILGLTIAAPANADQGFEVAQLVCVPTASYFSIELRVLEDIDPKDINTQKGSSQATLVWPESLETQPFECRLNRHSIDVHLVPASPGTTVAPYTPCATRYSKNIEISWDGQKIACLSRGATGVEHRAQVTLSVDGLSQPLPKTAFLEQCATDLAPVDADKHIIAAKGTLRCETKFVDMVTGQIKP